MRDFRSSTRTDRWARALAAYPAVVGAQGVARLPEPDDWYRPSSRRRCAGGGRSPSASSLPKVAWTPGFYLRYADALPERTAALGGDRTPAMVEQALWAHAGGKAGNADE
jgi:hypothetical protein